jgi:hypothetical protein
MRARSLLLALMEMPVMIERKHQIKDLFELMVEPASGD